MRPHPVDGLEPVSILVVDDDQAIRESIAEILEDEGYNVVTAGDGAQALQLLKRLRPKLIILDLNMPVLSGDEFRLVQRLDPDLRRIPTVVLSAVDRMPERASELQAAACIAKPIKLPDLLAVAEQFCGTAAR
jgi:CheY-like chemotaxis protein